MQILNSLYKRSLEHARGRIMFYEGLWEWDDNPPAEVIAWHESGSERKSYAYYADADSTSFTFYRYNEDHNRFYRLVHGPSVDCSHPKWSDSDHIPYAGKHWIPSRLCKRCEHYRKGGSVRRRIRYPTCAWRTSDSPEKDAASSVLKAWSDATAKAQDILG